MLYFRELREGVTIISEAYGGVIPNLPIVKVRSPGSYAEGSLCCLELVLVLSRVAKTPFGLV